MKEVIVDMDGVLVDLIGGAGEIAERIGGSRKPRFNPPNDSLADIFGVDEFRMYAELASMPPEFWEELRPYPWCKDLLYALRGVFTSVSIASYCVSRNAMIGKLRWIEKNKIEHFRLYLSTCDTKHIYVYLDTRPVIIDDRESIVVRCREAGGRAILFPQPWNIAGSSVDDELSRFIPDIKVRHVIREIINTDWR